VVRARWLLVAIALAILVPRDQALAVRIERRGDPSAASAGRVRTDRVTRWRDTVRTARRPEGPARVVRDRGPADARSRPVGSARETGGTDRVARERGPIGIVRGPGGTERVLGDREATGKARVDVQIDRTRRMLDLVRDRAERCGSVEARDAVRRAVEMQDRAESAARAGRQLGALQLTRGAREQGLEALRHCGHTGRSPEGVVSALGRTDELLTLERERLSERRSVSSGERTGALQRAAAAQRQAHDEFRNGRLESSLRLTQEARQSLRSGARRPAGPWPTGAKRGRVPGSE
jgi:hypothetical protein